MLLIEFDPSEYDEHMRRWWHWKNHLQTSGRDIGSGTNPLASRMAGTAIGGTEPTLRTKKVDGVVQASPITARGKQTRTPGVIKQYTPDGYDTEQAIDFVVTELGFMYPAAMQVIESNFGSAEPVHRKAKRAGFSYSDYRRKLHEGKMQILVAMRFFTIKKPRAFKRG